MQLHANYTHPSLHMLKLLTLTGAADVRHNLRPMSNHFLHHKKRSRQLYFPIFQGLQTYNYHSTTILLRQLRGTTTNTYYPEVLCWLHPAFIQKSIQTQQESTQHRTHVDPPHHTEAGFVQQTLKLHRCQRKGVLNTRLPTRTFIENFHKVGTWTATADDCCVTRNGTH